MPECPYCGRWFKTKRGLKQHISKSHMMDMGFTKVLDLGSIDPLGAAERRAERQRKRKKKKGGLFDLF